MSRFLDKLETNLMRTSPATAELVGSWLDEHMISFQHLAKSLAEHIPAVLTIPVAFSPGASENGIAATLEDIATRLLCKHHVTFPPVIASTSSSGPRRRSSLGSLLVQSIQSFSKEFSDSQGVLDVAAHGQRAAQRMSILMLAATFITAVWRGCLARQHATELRIKRDACFLIAWHVRGWQRRRRQRMAAEQEQSPTENAAPEEAVKRQAAEAVNCQMALSRLRAARMRDQRMKQLKMLARMSSFEDRGDEVEYIDAMLSRIIIAVYARRWLNRRATERAASRRQAAEAAAAAAAAEEERMRAVSMKPVAMTPELRQAKEHMRNRRLERAKSAPAGL